MIDCSPWTGRPHPGRKVVPLVLSKAQRDHAEELLRMHTIEQRVARRARALLMLSENICAGDIAKVVGVNVSTINDWRARFQTDEDSIAFLKDAPRPGRRVSLFPTQTPRASSPKRVARRAT